MRYMLTFMAILLIGIGLQEWFHVPYSVFISLIVAAIFLFACIIRGIYLNTKKDRETLKEYEE